jgi:hypothetical protein
VTIAAALRVRVWVPDVWDVVELEVAPDRSLSAIKAAALRQAIGQGVAPEDFEVKYRGALADESRTPLELAMPDGAPLIVLPARRRPVR